MVFPPSDNKLFDVVHFAVNHSTLLNKNATLNMGPQQYQTIQLLSFATMVSSISDVIIATCKHYENATGNQQSFLNVAHDIWDSKNWEILGVTVMFISLPNWHYLQLPVGLLPAVGKNATDCTAQIQTIISCYGVSQKDIFSSINDTTNLAVKTGENVSGKKGSCGMHLVDLSMEHATGQSK